MTTEGLAAAKALEIFDLLVEAVSQGTGYSTRGGYERFSHSFISAWEAAWVYLGIKAPDVSASEFAEAVAAKRQQLMAELGLA